MELLMLVLAIVACLAVHEGGHFLLARVFGHTIAFRFEWGLLFGKFPVPRFIWDMPEMEKWKQQIVAVAGFGLEFIVGTALFLTGWDFAPIYGGVAAVHLIAYKFYAGEDSDFKWLANEKEEGDSK